jgi:hypothetical protein
MKFHKPAADSQIPRPGGPLWQYAGCNDSFLFITSTYNALQTKYP